MSTINEWLKKHFGNRILYPIWSMSNKEESKLLDLNLEYKNIHQGKRCFILGNGPSMKMEDLSVLKDEYVFTVNQFYRSDKASIVKPDYHFWADDTFFIDDGYKARKEIIECMRDMYKYNPNVVSFFPIKHRGFVKKHSIDSNMKVSYFYSPFRMENHMRDEIDFSKFSINWGTVVQWCISMAIYMGFKEIYLMGCDNTQIITIMKSAMKTNDSDDYIYTYSDAEKKRMEKMVESKSLVDFLTTYINVLKDYKLIFDYCNSRNIRIINCSATTLIDCIPRKSFSEIIKK